MRWESKVKTKREASDTRRVLRFLLLPKRLDGQWRWLEFATIEQVMTNVKKDGGVAGGCGTHYELQWVSKHWVDGDK